MLMIYSKCYSVCIDRFQFRIILHIFNLGTTSTQIIVGSGNYSKFNKSRGWNNTSLQNLTFLGVRKV